MTATQPPEGFASAIAEDALETPARSRRGRRALRWSLGGSAVAGALFMGVLWMDSGGGQRFLTQRLAGVETQSGLSVRVGRIEGSLFNAARLGAVELRDPQGTFAVIDQGAVRWRPLALLRGDIVVDSIEVERARWLRRPVLRPTPPDDQWLPDGRTLVDRFRVGQLMVAPAVAGRLFELALDGRVLVQDSKIDATAQARARDSSDRANLTLLADPGTDRFDLALDVTAPADGFLAGLAGLDAAATVKAAGKGTFQRWDGGLAMTLGGAPLTDLTLTLTEGRLRATGPIRPVPALAGPLRELLARAGQLDGEGSIADRVVTGTLRLAGPRARLELAGGLDTTSGRLRETRLRLEDPDGTLLASQRAGIAARGVQAEAQLSGPLERPAVVLTAAAEQLRAGSVSVQRLSVRGGNRVDDGLPFDLKLEAARLQTGSAAADAYLTTPRLELTVRRAGDDLLIDRYRATTDRLALSGVGRYLRASSETRLSLQSGTAAVAAGTLGTVPTRLQGTLTLTGAGAAAAVLTAQPDVRATTLADNIKRAIGPAASLSGRYSFAGGVLAARDLVVDTAAGRFRGALTAAPGRLAGTLAGTLVRWDVVAAGLAGTAPLPIQLTLAGTPARPGVTVQGKVEQLSLGGVLLTDLDARLAPEGDSAFRAAVNGGSPLGPLRLSGLVVPGGPRLAIRDLQGDIGPLRVAGAVERAVTGLWAGAVRLRPGSDAQTSGLRADVTLADDKGEQTAQLVVSGRDVAQRWNDRMLLAQTLSLTADARFGPRWTLRASGEGTDVGSDQWQADRLALQASGDAQGLRGTLRARGNRGVPYDATATLSRGAGARPPITLSALTGTVGSLNLALAAPVTLITSGTDWEISPAQISIGGGQAVLAARQRRGTLASEISLRDVDLTALDLIRPGLGLSGRSDATVRLALRQDRLSLLDATLEARRVRRAGLFQAALPLDLRASARLDGDVITAGLSGFVNRQPTGQSTLTLRRARAGGFLDNPQLGGQIRWNGPLEALWGLIGLPDHDLRGRAQIEATLAGQLRDPDLKGSVKLDGGRYESIGTGVVIADATLAGTLAGDRFTLTQARGRMNRTGTVTATGSAELSATRGYPAMFELKLDKAGLVQRDDLSIIASGPLTLSHGTQGGRIAGALTVQRARLLVGPRPGESVPTLSVRERGGPVRAATGAQPDATRAAAVRPWALDVAVTARNRVVVQGLGLDSEWGGQLRLAGTVVRPRVAGTLSVVRGSYEFAGRRFTVDRGVLTFDGGERIDPAIDVQASARVRDTTGVIAISGTSARPQIAFRSTPELPQDEVLARILFGTGIQSLSPLEAVQLAGALATLSSGNAGNLNVINQVRRLAGIDRLRVVPADASRGIGTAVSGGKYLTDRVYVELASDGRGYTATTLEVDLTRSLSILSQIATLGGTNVSVRWSRNY